MQMQLASIPVLCEPPLAAMPQLSEKPHLGFATKKTTWKPAPNVCNFTVTLGLQVVVVENGVRKTYSARYYNAATGRFMSRDPFHGYIDKPATLHKYLYAGGDPVNGLDPSGWVTVTKPQGGLGGAIGEWAGIIQMISIRAFVIQTVTIPVYLASDKGMVMKLLIVTGASIAISESCELVAIANEMAEVTEQILNGGDYVTGPGMNCNAQPHPYDPPE
jgi:RHS repeat-associated protein